MLCPYTCLRAIIMHVYWIVLSRMLLLLLLLVPYVLTYEIDSFNSTFHSFQISQSTGHPTFTLHSKQFAIMSPCSTQSNEIYSQRGQTKFENKKREFISMSICRSCRLLNVDQIEFEMENKHYSLFCSGNKYSFSVICRRDQMRIFICAIDRKIHRRWNVLCHSRNEFNLNSRITFDSKLDTA